MYTWLEFSKENILLFFLSPHHLFFCFSLPFFFSFLNSLDWRKKRNLFVAPTGWFFSLVRTFSSSALTFHGRILDTFCIPLFHIHCWIFLQYPAVYLIQSQCRFRLIFSHHLCFCHVKLLGMPQTCSVSPSLLPLFKMLLSLNKGLPVSPPPFHLPQVDSFFRAQVTFSAVLSIVFSPVLP